jgi:VIT1/CCC1 family predicted Fe2+/Mn2+ transporter
MSLKVVRAHRLQYADMTKDHAHTKAEIASRLADGNGASYLRDMIYGGIDGAVTTFAIVAGVAGAGLSPQIIVILGLANILADGFSMAASSFSGIKAELDDRARIVKIEERHIRDHREGELEELRQILALRGLEGKVLEDATQCIAKNEAKWIGLMLTDEYGLASQLPHPLRSALATFVAFLLAGSIPLLPFVLQIDGAFETAIWMTLLTFFLIGAGKSRWSLAQWWWSGGETLLIGSTAALIAFLAGSLFHP